MGVKKLQENLDIAIGKDANLRLQDVGDRVNDTMTRESQCAGQGTKRRTDRIGYKRDWFHTKWSWSVRLSK